MIGNQILLRLLDYGGLEKVAFVPPEAQMQQQQMAQQGQQPPASPPIMGQPPQGPMDHNQQLPQEPTIPGQMPGSPPPDPAQVAAAQPVQVVEPPKPKKIDPEEINRRLYKTEKMLALILDCNLRFMAHHQIRPHDDLADGIPHELITGPPPGLAVPADGLAEHKAKEQKREPTPQELAAIQAQNMGPIKFGSMDDAVVDNAVDPSIPMGLTGRGRQAPSLMGLFAAK